MLHKLTGHVFPWESDENFVSSAQIKILTREVLSGMQGSKDRSFRTRVIQLVFFFFFSR